MQCHFYVTFTWLFLWAGSWSPLCHPIKKNLESPLLRCCWMLYSDWCANIFRETHGWSNIRLVPGNSWRITCPYHLAKWFQVGYFKRSYNLQQRQKNYLTKQINIADNWIKITPLRMWAHHLGCALFSNNSTAGQSIIPYYKTDSSGLWFWLVEPCSKLL